ADEAFAPFVRPVRQALLHLFAKRVPRLSIAPIDQNIHVLSRRAPSKFFALGGGLFDALTSYSLRHEFCHTALVSSCCVSGVSIRCREGCATTRLRDLIRNLLVSSEIGFSWPKVAPPLGCGIYAVVSPRPLITSSVVEPHGLGLDWWGAHPDPQGLRRSFAVRLRDRSAGTPYALGGGTQAADAA